MGGVALCAGPSLALAGTTAYEAALHIPTEILQLHERSSFCQSLYENDNHANLYLRHIT